MKRATKIILAAFLAGLLSLGSLCLSEHGRTVTVNPDLQGTGAERVCAAAFPMRVAWIASGSLYILGGSVANARPVQVKAAPGGRQVAWINGWSPDGR